MCSFILFFYMIDTYSCYDHEILKMGFLWDLRRLCFASRYVVYKCRTTLMCMVYGWLTWHECNSVRGRKARIGCLMGFSDVVDDVQYHEVLGSLVGLWAQRVALFFNIVTVGAVAVVQIIACARYRLLAFNSFGLQSWRSPVGCCLRCSNCCCNYFSI